MEKQSAHQEVPVPGSLGLQGNVPEHVVRQISLLLALIRRFILGFNLSSPQLSQFLKMKTAFLMFCMIASIIMYDVLLDTPLIFYAWIMPSSFIVAEFSIRGQLTSSHQVAPTH